MIRHTADARAFGAGDTSHALTSEPSRLHLETFIRDLGYPAERVEEVIFHFRRERGAMTVDDAAGHLADWMSAVDRVHAGDERSITPEDATASFVLSGAAMWHPDTLFADPSALPPAHRAALSAASTTVVPLESPLPMPPQDLAGPRWGRRRRSEPTVRRVSWMSSR
jgi:hypothetical protein